jgi:hypothetical protein
MWTRAGRVAAASGEGSSNRVSSRPRKPIHDRNVDDIGDEWIARSRFVTSAVVRDPALSPAPARTAPVRPKGQSMNQSAVAGAGQRDYLVGMRNLVLGDLAAEDLASMLSENETLFVEHIGGLETAAAEALCSFANTLGGWFWSRSRTAPGTRASRMVGVRFVRRR